MKISPNTAKDDNVDKSTSPIITTFLKSCCSHFQHEMKHPSFHLLEENGSLIDIERSFAPSPTKPVFMIKTALFAWTLATIISVNISQFDHWYFSLAFLTQWALVFGLLYQTFSLAITLINLLASTATDDYDDAFPAANKKRTTCNRLLVRTTWCLFSIASTLEVVVGLSYWPFVLLGCINYPLTYINVMTHGGVAVLVLIDGLVINRIPLRIRQIIFPTMVGLMYMLWTLLHWLLAIGNPEEEDFDSIYEILDWENNKLLSSILGCGLILVVIPIAFFCVRLLSLWSGWFKFDGSWHRTTTSNKRPGTADTCHLSESDSDSSSIEDGVFDVDTDSFELDSYIEDEDILKLAPSLKSLFIDTLDLDDQSVSVPYNIDEKDEDPEA